MDCVVCNGTVKPNEKIRAEDLCKKCLDSERLYLFVIWMFPYYQEDADCLYLMKDPKSKREGSEPVKSENMTNILNKYGSMRTYIVTTLERPPLAPMGFFIDRIREGMSFEDTVNYIRETCT